MQVRLKRIYDEPAPDDGYRILVDRLWPRGMAKDRARLDEWNKSLSPSHALRKWFDHKPERYPEFTAKYRDEMVEQSDQLYRLRKIGADKTLTLLFSVRDPDLSHAPVLRDILLQMD